MDEPFTLLPEDEDPLPDVIQAGLRLLVRREHSRLELSRKLAARGYGASLIHSALEQLEEQGQLSEVRFTQQYISSRIRKGYGPVRIRQELAERGIAELQMDDGFTANEVDWYSLMERACIHKYGNVEVDEYKGQAKRARFLEYRGFPHELIRDLIWG